MTPLVEATGLSRDFALGARGLFGRSRHVLRAVDRVDLAILPGETVGLVGESGSGKSTLGRLLIRLVEPTAGRIRFGAEDITRLGGRALAETRRAMQIVFQDPYGALDPRMPVEQIVMEPLRIHGARADAAARRAVAEMLDLVGLPPRAARRFPHEFSGGQRQRIGIARALILRPQFVVADEPVSALDVSVQAQIINLLTDLQRELGLTYLFIAHDLAVVRHIASRVAVMYLGKIVELAEKSALYAEPLHPYTQALIAAVPVRHPSARAAGRVRRAELSGDVPSALAIPSGCRFHPRCPHAMALCREREPAPREVRPGHVVSCHLVNPA
ncbi:MAG: ABC transporter ATP-binding protein [Rhodospirillales bacterium]|nr:ABC transporter ATP-binding protein [Rhodospirillales bacterium]